MAEQTHTRSKLEAFKRKSSRGLRVVFMSIVALVTVFWASAVSASGTSVWSISAQGTAGLPTGSLGQLSCSSPSACLAVGSASTGQLVAAWNGTTWSRLGLPTGFGGTYASSSGVACVSKGSCFVLESASGGTGANNGVLHWGGGRWTKELRTTADPISIACSGRLYCVAVFQGRSGRSIVFDTYVWRGASWVRQPASGGGSPGYSDSFRSVACAKPSMCFAVGSEQNLETSSEVGLVEQWNGKRWTRMNVPQSGSYVILFGVSCGSPTRCVLVGSGDLGSKNYRAFSDVWDDSSWQLNPMPNPGVTAGSIGGENGASRISLNGLSCAAAASCDAVGYYSNDVTSPSSAVTEPLVEHFDGTSWSVVSSPPVAETGLANLSAISCFARGCIAVGNPGNANSPPLIETSTA